MRAEQILAVSARSRASVSRQNVLDLLLNRPERVQARMQTVAPGCLGADGNPAIWLGLENSIVAQAGSAAFEHTAQLAQSLMPECPQPYAELGNLYRASLGYEKAAQMYQRAVLHSAPGPQLGAYAFALGDLNVTELGNWGQAVAVLPLAEANPGWEGSLWYYGAAAIDLGQALQASGRCPEAQLAYKRVLDCQACAARWPDARAALAAKPLCGA